MNDNRNPAPERKGALNDSEITDALWSAGIPAAYHAKERSLQALQTRFPEAAKVTGWLPSAARDARDGKCLDLASDTRDGIDLVFLTARALVLSGASVRVLALPSVVNLVSRRHDRDGEHAAEWDSLPERDFLIVPGASGSGPPPYANPPLFEADWFLRGWLTNGKSLVVQGPVPFASCEWWSRGLRDLFDSACVLRCGGAVPALPAVRSRSNIDPR